MAELQGDQAALRCLAHTAREWRHHARTGAPRDVKTWNRVAMSDRAISATLGAAHNRKEPYAQAVQPRALLALGKGDVGLRPLARPLIYLAVESSGAHPVVERQLI